jgi:hypothetical protein
LKMLSISTKIYTQKNEIILIWLSLLFLFLQTHINLIWEYKKL